MTATVQIPTRNDEADKIERPVFALVTRLRRELRQVKLEREILSKAAAWFARETGTIPNGSTGS